MLNYGHASSQSFPLVSEQVKCIFNGATTEQKCYHSPSPDDSLSSFDCSGIGTCVADVKGAMGTPLTWKSSCGGYAYTTLDGNSEYANFYCPAITQPSITVVTPNGGESWQRGDGVLVEWKTVNIAADAQMLIRLRGYDTGLEYNLVTSINDGFEKLVVPMSIPVGPYKLEVKTAFDNQSYLDASDSYFKVVDSSAPTVWEQVKCVFNGSKVMQRCDSAYPSYSPLSFGCSGVETCIADVKGTPGTSLTWKSSCGGYAYTTLDGNSEYANFTCGTTNSSGN